MSLQDCGIQDAVQNLVNARINFNDRKTWENQRRGTEGTFV